MEWSPVMSGLVGGLIATVLSVIALRQQKRGRKEDGWTVLRPSPYIHLALFLSAGIAGFIAFLFLYGSSRPNLDPEGQELAALALFVAFAGGALWCWWWYYAQKIRWRGATIETIRFGRSETFSRHDIVSVEERETIGECMIKFSDGRKLRFSLYAHGAKQLIAAARRSERL